VVDSERRLAGIITQADLISGLYQQAKTPQQAPA
jgi:CBS domain-containing membrane protein